MERIANLTDAALRSATPTTPFKAAPGDWTPEFDAHEASLRRAASEAAAFVAEMKAGRPPRWLTLTGVTGCGKTMLARAIFEQARPLNPGNVAFWRTEHLGPRPASTWMTATSFARRYLTDKEYDLPEHLAPDWIVAIDDIGTAPDPKGLIAAALYRLANQRLGKWTVFTTNLTLGELGHVVDQRFASRVIRDENVFCKIEAPDFALVKKGLAPRGITAIEFERQTNTRR